jgi:acetyl-CoA C-acetyltransferase
MKDIYIVDGVRTAVGKFRGALEDVSAVELGRAVVAALVARAGLDAGSVDEVILGNVLSAGLGQNVARQVAMAAGIPKEKTAFTVNMVCGSGLRSVCLGAQGIRCGDARVVIAGGTENMSAAPYLLKNARSGYRMGTGELVDSMIHDGLREAFNDVHMGITAENIAEKYGISREQQDAYAARSQNRAEAAIAAGKFVDEMVPVMIPQKKGDPIEFKEDEFPRKGVTQESIAGLVPAFKKDGTVTAGNSSGINDQAAAVLIAGRDACDELALAPMARIVSYAWHGTDPAIMGIGPVEAVRLALDKAGWSLKDVELIEANEAFAVQTIAVGRELGWDEEIVNVNGGAIALGHPIGASGARILVSLVHEMRRRGIAKGLATLCIGGGMGIAMCVERETPNTKL